MSPFEDGEEKVSVLLIEDNHDIAEMIAGLLEERGFSVSFALDGVTGLYLAMANRYDVIILDLMLPGLDGLTVTRRLRKEKHNATPILMLTARDTLEDKLTGLEAGADDYLIKPVEIRELEARLRALVRRDRRAVGGEVLRVGDLSLDTSTLQVERAGHLLSVSPIELKLMTMLLRDSPRLVSRKQLELGIWGERLPRTDTLRTHVCTLRKAIDKPFGVALLRTRIGVGYSLESS